VDNLQCCISMPAVLGRGGVQKTFDVPFNDEEKDAMKRSVEAVIKCVEEVEAKRGGE
jgi:malate/lactate dehydrogenase